ncbi:hypothetical protein Q8F55_009099 [Vanrija albida]|uniref:F-box domain-containing protein n=1 Tax=Vanrija albida TaxID=181172 RepID=A0ABR3PSY1_9TREE
MGRSSSPPSIASSSRSLPERGRFVKNPLGIFGRYFSAFGYRSVLDKKASSKLVKQRQEDRPNSIYSRPSADDHNYHDPGSPADFRAYYAPERHHLPPQQVSSAQYHQRRLRDDRASSSSAGSHQTYDYSPARRAVTPTLATPPPKLPPTPKSNGRLFPPSPAQATTPTKPNQKPPPFGAPPPRPARPGGRSPLPSGRSGASPSPARTGTRQHAVSMPQERSRTPSAQHRPPQAPPPQCALPPAPVPTFPWLHKGEFGPVSPTLPDAPLERIARFLSEMEAYGTLASLVLCSKASHALATPVLYHTIPLAWHNMPHLLYGLGHSGRAYRAVAISKWDPVSRDMGSTTSRGKMGAFSMYHSYRKEHTEKWRRHKLACLRFVKRVHVESLPWDSASKQLRELTSMPYYTRFNNLMLSGSIHLFPSVEHVSFSAAAIASLQWTAPDAEQHELELCEYERHLLTLCHLFSPKHICAGRPTEVRHRLENQPSPIPRLAHSFPQVVLDISKVWHLRSVTLHDVFTVEPVFQPGTQVRAYFSLEPRSRTTVNEPCVTPYPEWLATVAQAQTPLAATANQSPLALAKTSSPPASLHGHGHGHLTPSPTAMSFSPSSASSVSLASESTASSSFPSSRPSTSSSCSSAYTVVSSVPSSVSSVSSPPASPKVSTAGSIFGHVGMHQHHDHAQQQQQQHSPPPTPLTSKPHCQIPIHTIAHTRALLRSVPNWEFIGAPTPTAAALDDLVSHIAYGSTANDWNVGAEVVGRMRWTRRAAAKRCPCCAKA